MATVIDTDNAGELLQPIFDAARKDFEGSLAGALTKSVEEVVDRALAKALPAEDKGDETNEVSKPEFDPTDPVQVEAHLKQLRLKKAIETVDFSDPDQVAAHLESIKESETLDKAEEPSEGEKASNQPAGDPEVLKKTSIDTETNAEEERVAMAKSMIANINTSRGFVTERG